MIAGRGIVAKCLITPGGFSHRVFLLLISFKAQVQMSGPTRIHFDKYGTLDWLGFSEIGGQSLCAM
jgi:hypothetical protein